MKKKGSEINQNITILNLLYDHFKSFSKYAIWENWELKNAILPHWDPSVTSPANLQAMVYYIYLIFDLLQM